ncbi:MAG: glutathione S-transferase family protein [Myxococcales bacterium]|nr:glutathione S-transferase family protein [Myxococcales bacterium]
MMIFHHFPRSTATQKVRLTQHYKGVQFDEERVVDLTRFDQLDPAYLALHPRGQVPTLVVDGQPIVESSIINEYLEERFPERPLLPADPLQRARIRGWTKYIDLGPTVQIASPTYRLWVAPALAGADAAALLEVVRAAPEAITRGRWERVIRGQIDDAEVAGAWVELEVMLDRMEALLFEQAWLFGQLSLADLETAPIVARIQHLGEGARLERRPRVRAWIDKIAETPAFAATYAFMRAAS